MKNIFKKLFRSVASFFNRMANQEAQRAIEIYRQISEVKTERGGVKK